MACIAAQMYFSESIANHFNVEKIVRSIKLSLLESDGVAIMDSFGQLFWIAADEVNTRKQLEEVFWFLE